MITINKAEIIKIFIKLKAENEMLNIVLFGPPGAGKGTQSAKIIEKYGLIHLSTGEILRNEICQNTQLGVEAKRFMDAGQLVPDDVVIGMIENKLEVADAAKGFIFDGFPRTEEQARALDKVLTPLGKPITAMIALDVPHYKLVERLLKRGQIEGRSDDTEEVIDKRITEYESKTRKVASYYEAQGKFYHVDGIGEIEEIFSRISEIIDAHNKKEKVK